MFTIDVYFFEDNLMNMPCNSFQLFNWALEPAEEGILDRLFELGYMDAAVWAKENQVDNIVEEDGPSAQNGFAKSSS